MTTLVDQPSWMPTRKLLAVIIAGAVTGAAQSLIAALFPDFASAEIVALLDGWVQAAVIAAAGYFTRERAA